MLLYYLIATLHVLVCVVLILVVLLQSGKGADLAGAFGGGATQTAFGSRGPASLLSRVTTVAAVIFMLTSLSLSLISSKDEARSILDVTRGSGTPTKTPAVQTQPQAPAPSPEEIKQLQEEIEAKQKQVPAGGQSQPQSAAPASPQAPGIQVKQQPPGKAGESKPSDNAAKPSSGQKP